MSAPYEQLTPDVILDSIDDLGLLTDGRFLALNSYENRVYQVGQEEGPPVIVKYYRPERWSEAALREEHSFARLLEDAEIPVVAPLLINGDTLHQTGPYRFAVFPRRGGRWPDLDNPENRIRIGMFMGRIHQAGRGKLFEHRLTLDMETRFHQPVKYLRENNWIPSHLEEAYTTLIRDLEPLLENAFARAGKYEVLRLHGDCHPGNILWTEHGAHFVDLDDCCNGPAIQDLWMLLSGDRQEQTEQLCDLVEGYEEFAEFDSRQLNLIEVMRTLRLIHYAAWLAQRWEDPAFPMAFPWFEGSRYWEEHVLNLREQAFALQEAPLII